jgi:AcrR family transcriptional regulator
VPTTDPPTRERLSDITRTAAQTRIIVAALDLFARNGVSGTSLQMIADALGVTKAAVYHQFPTKEEIVVAVAASELVRLEVALDAAEGETSRARALEVLLAAVVDLAVERRRMLGFLQADPVVVRVLAEHEPFQHLMERQYRLLTGDDASAEAAVPAAMVSAAIAGAVMHPLVEELDDDELRTNLLQVARRLFPA